MGRMNNSCDSTTNVIISLPPHLRTRRQVTPDEWVSTWDGIRVRRERKELAHDYVSNGYRETGWPTHPRATSIVSEDTGRSTATIERFHRQAKELGMLTEIGAHTFQDGKRATPLYALTVPNDAPAPPAALEVEFGALASTDWEAGKGWQNKREDAPPWGHGVLSDGYTGM